MSIASASSVAPTSYTELNTQVAFISTRCETHAPPSTKTSAALACLASSRVTSRTSTFVSTARMPALHVAPDAFLQLFQGLGHGAPGKQHPVDVLGAVAPRATDHDLAVFLVPFQHGAGTDTQPLADLGRNRDLSLRSQARMSQGHGATLPR